MALVRLVQGKQVAIDTGSLLTIASFNSYTGSSSSQFAGTSSFASTASYALNANINTGSFVTTSSFNAFTSSYNTGSFTGSFIGTHTGSLFGTSSWATNSLTSSYILQAVSASYALSSSFASTASIALQVSTSISTQNIQHNVLFVDTTGPGFIQVDGGLRYNPNQDLLTTTSSFAQTASYYIEKDPIFTAKSGSLATTGSNIFIGNQTITGSLTITGSNTLIGTKTITGSVFISGSKTIIGTNTITGSLLVSGSTTISGLLNVSSGITGSLQGTASYATQALSSSNAQTASYVLQAVSSSFASTASFAPNYQLTSGTGSMLAPYVLTSSTSSMSVATASFAQGGNGSFSGSFSGSGANLNSIPTTAVVGNFTQIATGSVTASVTPTQFSVVSGSMTEFLVTGTGATIGSAIADLHRITGSLIITGSNTVIGNKTITGSLIVSSSNATQFLVGSSSLFISSSGQVGIGTSAVGASFLFVSGGDIRYDLGGAQTATFISAGGIKMGFNGNTVVWQSGTITVLGGSTTGTALSTTQGSGNWGVNRTGKAGYAISTNGAVDINAAVGSNQTVLQVVSGSIPLLLVNTLGSVGIGTSTPNATLDVNGSVNISGSNTITGSLIVSSSNATQFLVGSSSLFVNSAGNVGIGTTTPISSLDIISSTTGSLRLSGSAGSQITLFRPGLTLSGFVKYTRATMDIGTANSDGLALFTNNVQRVTIASAGDISIASAGTQNALAIQNGSNPLLFVSSSGFIGMGTSTPNATLDVNGSVNISGSGVTTPFKVITAGTGAGAGSLFVTQSGVAYLINSSSAAQNLVVRENSTNHTNIRLENSSNYQGNITFTQGATGATIANNSKGQQLQITGPAGGVSIAAGNLATTSSTIDFVVGGGPAAFAATLAGRFTNSGRFLVNTSTDDGSNQLQVNGSTRIVDTTAASGSANSGSLLDLQQTWNTTGIPTAIKLNVTNTASGATSKLIDVQVGGVSQFNIDKTGKIVVPSTITAPGTTGAQPINKISGKVNAAAATTSLVVTNSLVTTSSIVICQLGIDDSTCRLNSVVEANGSFTINYIAPTAETVIKFMVIN